eukprot:gene24182-9772_t
MPLPYGADAKKSVGEVKQRFKTPEGRYLLQADKPGPIPFNHLRQTRLTLATLSGGGNEAGRWLIYNVADNLNICRPDSVQKDPARALGFNVSSSRTGFPSCHTFMPAKDGVDLLVGLGDGQVALMSLRAQLQASSSKPIIASMLSPESSSEGSRCTAVSWVPRSDAGCFVAAFTSGNIYVYKKINVLAESSISISKFSLGSSKSKAQAQSPFNTISVNGGGINDIALSPDGTRIAAACRDGALRLLDLATGTLIGGFQSYYGALTCCSFSPDGKYVAAGGEDDLVALYGMQASGTKGTGCLAEKYPVAYGEGHSSWVSRVQFDPWGGSGNGFGNGSAAVSVDNNYGVYRLGSAGQDVRLCLWDLQSPSDADPLGFGNAPPSSPCHARKPSVSSKSNGIFPSLPRVEMNINEPIVEHKLHPEPMSDAPVPRRTAQAPTATLAEATPLQPMPISPVPPPTSTSPYCNLAHCFEVPGGGSCSPLTRLAVHDMEKTGSPSCDAGNKSDAGSRSDAGAKDEKPQNGTSPVATTSVLSAMALIDVPLTLSTLLLSHASAGAKDEKPQNGTSPVATSSVLSAMALIDVPLMLSAIQMPPLRYQLGPRVEHINLDETKSGSLSDLVSDRLGISQSALQKPRRMFLPDPQIEGGGYFRVHLHPKRFPAAYDVTDWASRVIRDGSDFVVVPPTVDNIQESLMSKIEEVLGLPPTTLAPPHRLDVGTEGVMVLSKTSDFARRFQAILKEKYDASVMRKLYRCLSRSAPKTGEMVHWLKDNQRQRGEPPHTRAFPNQEEGAMRSELEILKVEEVQLTCSAKEEWGETAYESTILLKTGRTHQIRCQLAFEGCPLLGDELYLALSLRDQAEQRNAEGEEENGDEGGVDKELWSKKMQDNPLKPVALQAYRLEIFKGGGLMGPDPQIFEAGKPWWRREPT